MRDIRRNVLPKLYRALYGVMLVSIRMTTNMTTGNQQKHLLLRFDMKASFKSWELLKLKYCNTVFKRNDCSDIKIPQNESIFNLHNRYLGRQVISASRKGLEIQAWFQRELLSSLAFSNSHHRKEQNRARKKSPDGNLGRVEFLATQSLRSLESQKPKIRAERLETKSWTKTGKQNVSVGIH